MASADVERSLEVTLLHHGGMEQAVLVEPLRKHVVTNEVFIIPFYVQRRPLAN